ncbi:facilitated trehalose transporter Tret1-like [Anthonomus grandis grandis]|uniref:facilitated trehalose transporter Tret1-like n=1 Tax=Anthonomus grandis grandis TaxID=2921223 RepID=UPI00216614CF|nr:facilitated trehalose transporter Tret1-like [Anthonomus grandis grandis]
MGVEVGQNKCEGIREEGKIWPQILAVCIISLIFFSNGMSVAWSSPYSLVIATDKITYNITAEEAAYFIVVQPIGMIIAGLFFFKVAELTGRKKSLIVVTLPYMIFWLMTILAKTKWEFYIARIIGGVGDAMTFVSSPSYVGEITVPSIRGFWGNFPLFIHYGGQLFINVIGSYLNVRQAGYIGIVFPILVCLLIITVLPESPYQLIKDNKYEEAKKSIHWLRRKVNVDDDFESMKADVNRQLSERGTWKDLYIIDSNRRALRAGLFLRTSQQLCGISIFATYIQPIFQMAGGIVSPQYSSMVYGALVCSLNLLCCRSVDKWGRKPAYFYSLLSCGIILILMAIFFFIQQYQLANLDSFGWFPLVGMIFYVITYSFGLGVVPTLMLGELFSASIKSKGLCVLIFMWGASVFIITNLFNVLTDHLGLYASFLWFGISCVFSTILTVKWVPETKGKTLEEIQQELKK